jgi:two-component system OmpR family response regulator
MKPFMRLEALMERPGEVLSRDYLLDRCWDMNFESRSNIVDAQIRALRDGIDRPFGLESIETVRGHGYRLRIEPSA